MRKTDKFQFVELNGRLIWCDFGANLVQHFIGRYSRHSRYQTVLSKLQEIKTTPYGVFQHPSFFGGCCFVVEILCLVGTGVLDGPF